MTPDTAACDVFFASHGCSKPRGHEDEETLASHVCHCGMTAVDMATVFGDDADRLGLKGWDQE